MACGGPVLVFARTTEGGDLYLRGTAQVRTQVRTKPYPSTDQTVPQTVLKYGKTVPQLQKKTFSTMENRTQTVLKPLTIYSLLPSSNRLFALDRPYQRRLSRNFLFLSPICRAVFISYCLSLLWNFLFWMRSAFRSLRLAQSPNDQHLLPGGSSSQLSLAGASELHVQALSCIPALDFQCPSLSRFDTTRSGWAP